MNRRSLTLLGLGAALCLFACDSDTSDPSDPNAGGGGSGGGGTGGGAAGSAPDPADLPAGTVGLFGTKQLSSDTDTFQYAGQSFEWTDFEYGLLRTTVDPPSLHVVDTVSSSNSAPRLLQPKVVGGRLWVLSGSLVRGTRTLKEVDPLTLETLRRCEYTTDDLNRDYYLMGDDVIFREPIKKDVFGAYKSGGAIRRMPCESSESADDAPALVTYGKLTSDDAYRGFTWNLGADRLVRFTNEGAAFEVDADSFASTAQLADAPTQAELADGHGVIATTDDAVFWTLEAGSSTQILRWTPEGGSETWAMLTFGAVSGFRGFSVIGGVGWGVARLEDHSTRSFALEPGTGELTDLDLPTEVIPTGSCSPECGFLEL